MQKIKITKQNVDDEKLYIPCRECKRETNHLTLASIALNGSQSFEPHGYDCIDWYETYKIAQCQGCETVAFRKTHSNSEDMVQTGPDEIEFGTITETFPIPDAGRDPVRDDDLLPIQLNRIYSETIKSSNHGLPVLTGIGIRAIIETVCNDQKASGNNLYEKINDLVNKKVLAQSDSEILQNLRVLGNSAGHEVVPHSNVQLGLALDVIDHLLLGVYVFPHHSKAHFKDT